MKWVRSLYDLGEREFGENYPQHLWAQVDALAEPEVRWHLIGHLQVNKAKKTVPMVRMVHAVDSLKLLRTLDDLAADWPDAPARLPASQHVGRVGQARLVARRRSSPTPRPSPRAGAFRLSA